MDLSASAAENAHVGGKGTPRGPRDPSNGSPRRALQEEDENAVNSVLLGPAARDAANGRTQYDADLALARALQEQERAYYLLREQSMAARANADQGSDAEGHVGTDDEEDVYEEGEYVPGEGNGGEENAEGAPFDDEAFARALQEAEEREAEERVLALAGMNVGSDDGYGSGSEDEQWEEDGIDPDNMTYEELTALAEVVGNESKGLATDAIARLPKSAYKVCKRRRSSSSGQEQCVICRVEFEDEDGIITLPCKHHYHSPCIEQWLSINKVCPMCLKEVTPMKSRAASRRTSHLGNVAESQPSEFGHSGDSSK